MRDQGQADYAHPKGNTMTTHILDSIYPKLYLLLLGLSISIFCNAEQRLEKLEFTSSALTTEECNQLRFENVITKINPVPCNRLSRVNFSYMNELGVIKQDGILVVFDLLAPKVSALMQELLNKNFIISKARPIEAYHGDDNASMEDNNTSAFNGRAMIGSSHWSLHAYGAAIDINPIQNPFIEIEKDGTAKISPTKSAYYAVNRLNHRLGKSQRPGMAEDVVDIFAEHGFFVWGGYWDYPIDYQHFQVGPRSFVEKLVATERSNGEELLNKYISMYLNCRRTRQSNLNQTKARAVCLDAVVAKMQ